MFRKVPKPELEAVRLARLIMEKKAYERMIGMPQTLMEIEEWRELRRIVASLFNAFLSIVGSGIAAYVLSRKSIGWSTEMSIVNGLTVALIVMIAEIFSIARHDIIL